jgi:hypothetical protein
MWTNNNFIEFQEIKDKDFFLLRFDCPVCGNRNEINFIGFDIQFFKKYPRYIWSHELGCPSCDQTFQYLIKIYVIDEKIGIDIISDLTILDHDVKVNYNTVYYSLDMKEYNQYVMDIYLELDIIHDIVNKNYFLAFNNSIIEIKLLLQENYITSNLTIRKLIFTNIITVLETYLSDLLITEVNKQERLQVRLVEKSNIFKKIKIDKSDIFRVQDNLKKEIIDELNKISFHSLKQVIPMFRNVLEIDFSHELKHLPKDILKRHDIVHRNGKSTDSVKTEVTMENLSSLLQEVQNIVKYIEREKINKYNNTYSK